MKEFLEKNKVFLLGLLAVIGIYLQQFVGQATIDYKVLLFGGFMAILAYLADQWKGQALSATGIIGTLAMTFITVHNTGQFTWGQFILQAVIAIIAVATKPPVPLEKKP